MHYIYRTPINILIFINILCIYCMYIAFCLFFFFFCFSGWIDMCTNNILCTLSVFLICFDLFFFFFFLFCGGRLPNPNPISIQNPKRNRTSIFIILNFTLMYATMPSASALTLEIGFGTCAHTNAE